MIRRLQLGVRFHKGDQPSVRALPRSSALGQRTVLIGILTGMFLLTACSEPGAPGSPTSGSGRVESGHGSSKTDRPGSASRAGSVIAMGPANEGASDSGTASESLDAADAQSTAKLKGLQRSSAVVREPTPDREQTGETPAYTEAVLASLSGARTELRLVLEFYALLPAVMSDEEVFLAGFDIDDGSRELSISAVATSSGWSASFKDINTDETFAGTFRVSGSRIEFRVKWTELDGDGSLRWGAIATLLEQVANAAPVTRSTDLIPNDGPVAFP